MLVWQRVCFHVQVLSVWYRYESSLSLSFSLSPLLSSLSSLSLSIPSSHPPGSSHPRGLYSLNSLSLSLSRRLISSPLLRSATSSPRRYNTQLVAQAPRSSWLLLLLLSSLSFSLAFLSGKDPLLFLYPISSSLTCIAHGFLILKTQVTAWLSGLRR